MRINGALETKNKSKIPGDAMLLSIVIPVHNEGINLRMMLKILKATIEVPHELLIVYDSTHDDSRPVVEAMKQEYSGLRDVRNTLRPGVCDAIRSGIHEARGEYILILTADDMGPVLSVEKMYALMQEGYDVASATRYANGGRYLGGVLLSHLMSRTANKIFCWLVRTPLTDATVGIKMFRKSILDKITLEAREGWAIAFELAIKAQLANLKITEVPVISINRFYGGRSSFKPGPWIMEYSRWLWWGVRRFYGARRLRFQAAARRTRKMRGYV